MQDYKTNNAQQIVSDMQDIGFAKVVCVSSTPKSWENVAKITMQHSNFVIPAFGLHPWYIKQATVDWQQQLRCYLNKFSNAQVGECGLDCLKVEPEKQQEVFEAQINLAKEFNRPLNIHILKADEWFLTFLPRISSKFMLHSFSGSIELLHTITKAGGFISLSSGVLKRKNGTNIIKEVPLSKLLIESDGPYLSNYNNIPELVTSIADVKGIDAKELSSIIYSNFKEFNYGK